MGISFEKAVMSSQKKLSITSVHKLWMQTSFKRSIPIILMLETIRQSCSFWPVSVGFTCRHLLNGLCPRHPRDSSELSYMPGIIIHFEQLRKPRFEGFKEHVQDCPASPEAMLWPPGSLLLNSVCLCFSRAWSYYALFHSPYPRSVENF